MKDKLNHLNAVRQDIGEEQYRLAVAAVLTEHYIKVMLDRKREVSKAMLYQIVNLHLRRSGIDEVSYGFIRVRAERAREAV